MGRPDESPALTTSKRSPAKWRASLLVSVGLLVWGVIVGQVLFKAVKIRSAITQLQHYSAAYNTFQLKYGRIMGDCPNATDYLGSNYVSASTSSACTSPTNGIETGDGEGKFYGLDTASMEAGGVYIKFAQTV